MSFTGDIRHQRDMPGSPLKVGKSVSSLSFTDFISSPRKNQQPSRAPDAAHVSPRVSAMLSGRDGVMEGAGDNATLLARIRELHPSYSNWTAELVAYQITQATEALEEEKRLAYIKEQERRAELRANQITKLLDVPELTDADGNSQSVNKSRVWLAQNSPSTLGHYEEILSQAMQLEQHRRRGHADGIATVKEDILRARLEQRDLKIEANIKQQQHLRRVRCSKEDPWIPRAAKKREETTIESVSQRKSILEASEQSLCKHNKAAAKQLEMRSKEVEKRRRQKAEKASRVKEEACFQETEREDAIRQGIERKVAHVAYYSEMEAETRTKAAALREAVMISVSESVERTQLEKTALSYLAYVVKESHTIFRKQSVNDWATYVTALKRKERDEKASGRLVVIDEEDEAIRKQLSFRQKERVKAALVRHEAHHDEKQLQYREANKIKQQRSRNPHPPSTVPQSPRTTRHPHPPPRHTPSLACQAPLSTPRKPTDVFPNGSPPTTAISLPSVGYEDVTSQARDKSFPRATPFTEFIHKSESLSSKKQSSSPLSSRQVPSSPLSSPRRIGDKSETAPFTELALDDSTTHLSETKSLLKHMSPEERLHWEEGKLLKLKLANERKAMDDDYRAHTESSKRVGRSEVKYRHQTKQFEKWSKVVDSIEERNAAIKRHSMEQEQQRIQLLERAEERRMAAIEKRLQNDLARESAADSARATVIASQQSGKQTHNNFSVISGERERDRVMIAAIWGSLDAQPYQQQPDSASNSNSPKRKMTMGYLNPTQSSQEAYAMTASLRATLKSEAIQTVKERAREHNMKIEDTLSAWREQLLHDADTKTFETSKRRVEAAGQRREEALALKSAKGASMSLTLSLDR